MKKHVLFSLVLSSNLLYSQDVSFRGCPNLFNDQLFVFNKLGTDEYNKGIYETTPLDGQPCGGLGTCEFRIKWNNNLTRWEFLADEGNGTFAKPYVIYYNSTGDNTLNNPPANNVGEWVENVSLTIGECGGNLTPANSTLTGDVHTTLLAVDDYVKTNISIFPNPTTDLLTVSGIEIGKTIEIYNTLGQLILSIPFQKNINTQSFISGIYLLKIKGNNSQIFQTKFIKK